MFKLVVLFALVAIAAARPGLLAGPAVYSAGVVGSVSSHSISQVHPTLVHAAPIAVAHAAPIAVAHAAPIAVAHAAPLAVAHAAPLALAHAPIAHSIW